MNEMRSHADAEPSDPLSGIRVLDFTSMLAGPYCTRLLADAGADVIKIEPPTGDYMRHQPPMKDGHSRYFGHINAGKRSVVLDLKSAESLEYVHRMVRNADVLVENFRPGVMDRLGLGHKLLNQLNPRLIQCSISGYGQEGPDAQKPAYAPIVHATSGYDLTLKRYQPDTDKPAATAVQTADILTAVYAFSAIQMALFQRERTGAGQRIDTTLMESMLSLQVYELQEAQQPVDSPRPTYGPLRTLDGYVVATPVNEKNFQALCAAVGHPEWREAPEFRTPTDRVRNWTLLMNRVEDWTSSRTSDDCVALLSEKGVPAARYREIGETLNEDQAEARGRFSDVNDAAGTYRVLNAPFQMSGARTSVRSAVPEMGEHTEEILRTVAQLSADELSRFLLSRLR